MSTITQSITQKFVGLIKTSTITQSITRLIKNECKMYAITQNKVSSGWYKMSKITENFIRMIQDVYNDTMSKVRLMPNVYRTLNIMKII